MQVFKHTKIQGRKVLSDLANIVSSLVLSPEKHAHTTCQAHVLLTKIYDIQKSEQGKLKYLNQTSIKMPGCIAPHASVGPATTTNISTDTNYNHPYKFKVQAILV